MARTKTSRSRSYARGTYEGRRRGGHRGGKANTPAQQRARRQNIKKAQEARRSSWLG